MRQVSTSVAFDLLRYYAWIEFRNFFGTVSIQNCLVTYNGLKAMRGYRNTTRIVHASIRNRSLGEWVEQKLNIAFCSFGSWLQSPVLFGLLRTPAQETEQTALNVIALWAPLVTLPEEKYSWTLFSTAWPPTGIMPITLFIDQLIFFILVCYAHFIGINVPVGMDGPNDCKDIKTRQTCPGHQTWTNHNIWSNHTWALTWSGIHPLYFFTTAGPLSQTMGHQFCLHVSLSSVTIH